MTFTYNYCASANKEIQEIRNKYLPPKESKLDELKRLDREVQSAGTMQALILGIGGCLIFGAAMCMAMDVIGGGMLLGIPIGLIGIAGMLAAYPVHHIANEKTKARLAPRILQLADELQKNI